MSQSFAAIILAAGQGTRMKSALPKVLHEVAGLPMLAHVVRAALRAGAGRIVVVVGHGRELVEKELASRFGGAVETVVQHEQKGTGHATRCAMEALVDHVGDVVILAGDVPLLESEAIASLVLAKSAAKKKLSVLTSHLDDPAGYGRILRDAHGHVVGIREHKDASDHERAIKEWNTGVYCVDASFLRESLARLDTKNVQGELYLTDVVAMAAEVGGSASVSWSAESVAGVNDRAQLAELERTMRLRLATHFARMGVTIRDPETCYLGAEVTIEPDAVIEPNVHLRGKTIVRTGARLDTGVVLDDVEVRAGAVVKPYTVAQKSVIGEAAQVGPFSHLRPDSVLGPDVHIGNFVETKKTTLGKGSKANHLAYLGDGIVGEKVNVGAGTIFCNYDGFQKHTTVLEDGCFIGSDSQLIAPITIGKNAYVGTGTTVTKNVPEDALAISRVKQDNKLGYASRLRERMRALAAAAQREKAQQAELERAQMAAELEKAPTE
ncbi:MAG: bifunctional UDP-N-acetylglucosamine diphosphorylase/glucosamine-1-phosphate N-acetyltransferase GlmU [Sandaracinus sp.]